VCGIFTRETLSLQEQYTKMDTKHVIINGDSRQMNELRDKSVHLVITSPPYWQLKDYGAEISSRKTRRLLMRIY
jgi:DNA modification methylase